MNVQKTALKIAELNAAVAAEASTRREKLMLHNIQTNSVVEKINALFNSFLEDFTKRQAKKAIELDKKCREAEDCLCSLQKPL